MAIIISLVTGLREEDLEGYAPLKHLLRKANRPGKEVRAYDFGLLRFRWPEGFTKDGEPILDIRLFENDTIMKLRRLENRMWSGRPSPDTDIRLARLAYIPVSAPIK